MTKRMFVGLEISEEARNRIAEYSARIRDRFRAHKVSWERPEKYHLTVKFLGDVNTDQIEALFESTAFLAKKFKPISLEMKSTGVFPSPKNPRILWIGINEENKSLEKLALQFESEFEKLGFKREKRIFHPHLTIARIREPRKAGELALAHLNEKFKPVQFTISEIIIFESQLKQMGSIYIPINKIAI